MTYSVIRSGEADHQLYVQQSRKFTRPGFDQTAETKHELDVHQILHKKIEENAGFSPEEKTRGLHRNRGRKETRTARDSRPPSTHPNGAQDPHDQGTERLFPAQLPAFGHFGELRADLFERGRNHHGPQNSEVCFENLEAYFQRVVQKQNYEGRRAFAGKALDCRKGQEAGPQTKEDRRSLGIS